MGRHVLLPPWTSVLWSLKRQHRVHNFKAISCSETQCFHTVLGLHLEEFLVSPSLQSRLPLQPCLMWSLPALDPSLPTTHRSHWLSVSPPARSAPTLGPLHLATSFPGRCTSRLRETFSAPQPDCPHSHHNPSTNHRVLLILLVERVSFWCLPN